MNEIKIECDFCGHVAPWGGRIFSMGPTVFYCRLCSPVGRRYGASVTREQAERLRLAYRLAVILRSRLIGSARPAGTRLGKS